MNKRSKSTVPVLCSADGNYEVRYKSNVLIYPDGEVLWIPPAIYQVCQKSAKNVYLPNRGGSNKFFQMQFF
jgi:hypothetical protein